MNEMVMIHYNDRPVSDRSVSLAQRVPPVKLSPPDDYDFGCGAGKTLPAKPGVPHEPWLHPMAER